MKDPDLALGWRIYLKIRNKAERIEEEDEEDTTMPAKGKEKKKKKTKTKKKTVPKKQKCSGRQKASLFPDLDIPP